MDIIIADDHELIGRGIVDYFKDHEPTYTVRFVKNKSELFYEIRLKTPEILIQDIEFGMDDARIFVQEIVSSFPEIKIIALSSHEESEIVSSSLSIGFQSYISKQAPLEEIIEAVRVTGRGSSYISKKLKERIQNELVNIDEEKQPLNLTKREREVLACIQNELSTKEIALKLKLSEKTVEGYRANLFLKFDVKNVVGLVKKSLFHQHLT